MDQHPHQSAEKSSGRQRNQSPQHLSYHRQQQMHQRHMQRIGGLHRLTADLAAMQFHDVEPLPLNLPQMTRVRQMQLKLAHARQQQQQQQQISPPISPTPTIAATATQTQQQQQTQQHPAPTQVQRQLHDPIELFEMPKSDSDSQDAERIEAAAKDAQETAEDASVLKRYRICHLVGIGNYARVYKGLFLANNKELAIKSINLSKTSENYRQKFLPRELSILRRVSHVNICKVYEIVQVSDRIFIIMQFCSRGTIADLLQRNQGPLIESIVRYLFAPTVDALVYLHSLDIAHRDVKIENILLDHDYVPKLTDFSYSCWVNDSHSPTTPLDKANKTVTKSVISGQQKQPRNRNQSAVRLNETFCGTLPYLSPEMIRQSPYDSRKTDVWSLGVCLYVMLNDRLPFPFNDIKLMVKRQLARDFKFRASVEVSDACRDLIGQLLDPDFSRRTTSLDASRHIWMSGPRERPNR